jgi:hypothetical protein
MSSKLTYIQVIPSPQAITEGPLATAHFEATKALMMAISGLVADAHDRSVSLELIAKDGVTSYLIAASSELAPELTHHLYAALPNAELITRDAWHTFDAPGVLAAATVQFAPTDGQLRSEEFSGNDPLQPILEVLSSVTGHQRLSVALTLSGAHSHGTFLSQTAGLISEGLRLAINGRPEHEETHKDKEDDKHHTAPLRANLNILALAENKEAATNLVKRAAAAYHQLTLPGKTSLRYEHPRRLEAWMTTALSRRFSQQTAFYLTANEAANLFHTPLNVRAFPKLLAMNSTHLPVPEAVSSEGITIGSGAYRQTHNVIKLSPADRLRHTYLIGQTGTGKSTLFQSAILQDIQNGDGCCFIDPHGEVIDWLLPRIPPERAKDVVLFDPSDPQAILGLNLLEWHTPQERDLIIQELILLFYKLFDPEHTGIIGPQFEHWLRSAALTITEPAVRGTLVDIPRLFTDKAFADATVAKAEHWAVKDFWNNQMASTADFHKSEMLNYFTSKFGSFLGNSVMYDILSQRHSAFDLRKMMDGRKILLVNLSKGRLGSLNAQLLGTLIVTKIQMAAMSRADTAPENRPPFYVYIDEFQNVVTDSFAAMLSEIRKYGVGLHLAHQYVDQLPENVKQAVAGNIGTLMAFRLGRTDAQWLANQFAPLTADDLSSIEPYHYHLRSLSQGQLLQPFTVAAPTGVFKSDERIGHAIRSRVHRYVGQSSSIATS